MNNIFRLTKEKIIVSVLLLVLFFLQMTSILTESPTFDEKVHVEAGYHFLTKQDFRWDPFNPPLGREIVALPVVFNHSLYNDPILLWPRTMVVFFSLGLAMLVYIVTKKFFGLLAGLVALLLLVFEPNLLAHGHYVTMDVTLSFFFLLTMFLYWVFHKNFTYTRVVLFGIIFGLTQTIKISALPFLAAAFGFIFIASFILQSNKKSYLKKIDYKKILVFILACSITMWSTYFFTLQPPLGYRFDKNRPAISVAKTNSIVNILLTQPVPLGSYLSTIKQTLLYNYSTLYRKDSFFAGRISGTGLPGYLYIPAILIKTPIPLLILLCMTVFIRPRKEAILFLLLPIMAILSTVLFTNTTIVIRYILPLYPLLIIYASQSISLFTTNIRRIILVCLLLWSIAGTLLTFPHPITFFNEFIGGRNNGYKYLVDSNLDWGQSLLSLKKYQLLHPNTPLQLAYFGAVNPSDYDISYERLKDINPAEKKNMKSLAENHNGIIAISATCYYFCGYYADTNLNAYELFGTIDAAILLFRIK